MSFPARSTACRAGCGSSSIVRDIDQARRDAVLRRDRTGSVTTWRARRGVTVRIETDQRGPTGHLCAGDRRCDQRGVRGARRCSSSG